MAPLFAGDSAGTAKAPTRLEKPTSLERLAERYASVIRRSLEHWAAGKATDDDARWIGWLLENRLVTNASNQTPRLERLIADYRLADSRIAAPKTFNGTADLEAGYDFPGAACRGCRSSREDRSTRVSSAHCGNAGRREGIWQRPA